MLEETADDGWRRSLAATTDEDLMALVRPEDRREVAFEPSVRGLAVRILPFTSTDHVREMGLLSPSSACVEPRARRQ